MTDYIPSTPLHACAWERKTRRLSLQNTLRKMRACLQTSLHLSGERGQGEISDLSLSLIRSEEMSMNTCPFVPGLAVMKLKFGPTPPTLGRQPSPSISATAHPRYRRLVCSTTCRAHPGLHWYSHRERAATPQGWESQFDPLRGETCRPFQRAGTGSSIQVERSTLDSGPSQ